MAPIDICLTLVKYSYAETESTSSPINWSHYSAVDLCVLVQGDDSSQGELSLSIVDRTTYMEVVDIAHYVSWANDARSAARKKKMPIPTEQLPIFGITKDALLALRYRLQDGRARRIQLRLEDDAKCGQLVDILQRRGLDFQAQRPRTSRPDTALSRLDTPTTENRPRTTQKGLVQPSQNQVPQSPFQPPRLGFSGLTQRPQSGSYENSAPFSSSPLPASEEYFRRKGQGAQIESRAHSSYSQSLANGALAGPLPTTFPPDQSTTFGTDMQFSTMSSLPAPRAVSDHNTMPEFGNNDSTAMAARSSNEAHHTVAENAYLGGTFSSDIPAPPQTSSSSGSQQTTNRIGTGDNRTLNTTGHSRPSSALELPPLQMPKILKARSTSALQSSLPGPTDMRPQAAQVQAQEQVQALTTQPNSTTNESPHPQLTSAVALGGGHARPDPSPLEQLIFSRRTSAQWPVNKSIPRVSSLLDAPHEIEETPEMNGNASFQQGPSQGCMSLGNAQASQALPNTNTAATAPGPAGEVSVQTYAAQRPEARDAALNKFMIDHLQDPAFTVLCADVESCWRRIALGL